MPNNSYKFRSKFEETVCSDLNERCVDFSYEPYKINYIVPSTKRTYLPDLILTNGIIVELKGRFLAPDRKKHLYIREQNPDLDIRIVFQNPQVKIGPKAKTTVAEWCDKNNFKWWGHVIPKAWIKENAKRKKTKSRVKAKK